MEAGNTPGNDQGPSLEDPCSWIVDLYHKGLIDKINSPNPEKSSFRIRISVMQRMRIQRLQIKLAQHARRLYDGNADNDWTIMGDDIQEYVQMLQEHDYMEICGHRSRDPFKISGERRADREVLDAVMTGFQLEPEHIPIPMTRWEWEDEKYVSVVLTRGENRHRRFFLRLAVSIFGAAFLVGPMWLMIIVRDSMVALWSTTIFIGVFGLTMACVLTDHIAVLSSTAAYAAVLVVFVALVAEGNEPVP